MRKYEEVEKVVGVFIMYVQENMPRKSFD